MQTHKTVQTDGYSESNEEAKHPGLALGLIMGIYPAVLIVVIILLFSGKGIISTFKYIFPNSNPDQREPLTPVDTLSNETKP